ncbi:Two-component hybrid sensor and regulator [Candidatus Terasakiella magnetica]|nr:Two-component hybrid sensor and regulator [Candidatus Terasakiella magnetica]
MTPKSPAILWRIVIRLSLTTLVAIVIAYSWLWWKYDSTSQLIRNRALAENAAIIGHHLSITPEGQLILLLSPAIQAAYATSAGNHRFGIRNAETGALLFQEGGVVEDFPGTLSDSDRDSDGNATFYTHNTDGPGPELMFGAAVPVNVSGHSVLIQVEQSGRDFDSLTRRLIKEFAEAGGWVGAPFLLSLLVVGILTVRSSLKPLQRLSEQAAAIGPTTTDVRLPIDGVPREIMPLVVAVNSALDRLEAGFQVQREFTADAAHELRTPLAVLRANVDTLSDIPARDSLAKDLDSMARLISQLLGVAQVEALSIPTDELADLGAITVDVGAFLAPMALKCGRMIEVIETGAVAPIHGSSEVIFNAVRNLVENALTHTPEGSTVSVRVCPPATIEVVDAGPGVPPEYRERIFQRFWRVDRRRSGAGLGLAIVKRIMEAHGGTVMVEEADNGGAKFSLIFPPPR